VLTTHRLMTRVGILSHTGRDIPLNRINNAMYEQSFFERIVNSGTLVVESAGEDGQQVFRNIPNADETQQLINRLVEGDHDRRSRNAAATRRSTRRATTPTTATAGRWTA
jgi:uncharacterized membrane protein YdbT with pleckstrin-like domain